jgi:hypothetical protein
MNFVCPHCGVHQVVTQDASDDFKATAAIGTFKEAMDDARMAVVEGTAIRCADPKCNRLSLFVGICSGIREVSGSLTTSSYFLYERLYPKPAGKPFPASVPEKMLEDYREAWSIINLSPKSSATLARRCLQAMIRDFCGIHERTLFKEIEVLEAKLAEDALPKGVEPETVAAEYRRTYD